MNIQAQLTEEIRRLAVELRSHEAALEAFQRASGRATSTALPAAEMRFVDVRPIVAIKQILSEVGHPMLLEEIMQRALAGGIATGKKRGHHNVRISIEKNLEIGNLVNMDGKIGMPGWERSKVA